MEHAIGIAILNSMKKAKGGRYMRFTDLNEKEICRLGDLAMRNKVEWVCFFKHISYKAQIFVLEDKYAFDILYKIYKVGGAIRKKDFINIAYKGDRNMYSYISKLRELNLLNQEGQRDSIIALTSISLSIIKKAKVKNSISISNITINHLDRAAFLLSVHEKGNNIIVDEYSFTADVTNVTFRDDSKQRVLLDEILQKDFSFLKSNQIYMSNNYDEFIIYALNPMDLKLKLATLDEMGFAAALKNKFKLSKIILPKLLEGKENVGELRIEEFKNLDITKVEFEFI